MLRSPELRRAESSWALHLTAEWAYLVAIGLFAYRAGGAQAVGLAGLLLMAPGAVTAPIASAVADRFRRERVVVAVGIGRSMLLSATTVAVVVDLAAGWVYALAAFGSVVGSLFRPAHASLLPLLVGTPRELVAANVVASTTEGMATFLGPAAAGFLFAAAGAAPAFAFAAGAFLASALAVHGIDTERQRIPSTRGAARETLLGLRRCAEDPHVRVLVGLFGAQTLVRGALNTLIVLVAFELLALGEAGVGLLNAALGIGGLVGGLLAVLLVGRPRLGGPVGLGLACWGLPIALIGVFPEPMLALAFFGLVGVGVGNSVFDIAGLTLLQRLVADGVLARVLGALEGLALAAIGLGAFAAPFLVEAVGLRRALLVTGAVLPLLALVSRRALARVDGAAVVPQRELEVARYVDLFAALPANVVEQLARSLFPVAYPAGARVIREGDAGDRFFIVTEGIAEITRNGRVVAALGPGDYFGEIAPLRDEPRTASVTARTDLAVYALDGDDFVAAVTGYRRSASAAEAVTGARLAQLNAAA